MKDNGGTIVSLTQTTEENEMARLIVEALNIDDMEAEAIAPEAPLFGDGLGLDSIDALELSLEIANRYGVHLSADDENNPVIFQSLRALTAHVQANRAS